MAQAKKSKQENGPGGPMSPVQFGEQARALNEQIIEARPRLVRMLYSATSTGCRRSLRSSAICVVSAGEPEQMDWFASMLKAQADFTEQFAKMVGGMAPASSPELVNPPARRID